MLQIELFLLAFCVTLLLTGVGLIILCFNQSIFILLPEGLLLTTVGVVIFYWLRRNSSDATGPMILHNPINQILIFLGSIAAIISGLVMLWHVNQLLTYGIIGILLVRHFVEVYLNSEGKVIRQIVAAYKEVARTNPTVDEQQRLKLTYGVILLMWGESKSSVASDIKENNFKSLYDVVASLLSHRDVYTGSNYMGRYVLGIDISSSSIGEDRRWLKEEKRKQFIDRLLG